MPAIPLPFSEIARVLVRFDHEVGREPNQL